MAGTIITAGDTYAPSLFELADYPAGAGWTLKQRMTPRGTGTAINLTASAEGDAYRFNAAAATTANWPAGAYTVSRWVEKGAEIYTVSTSQLTIAADPRSLAVGTDTRSQARKALDDAKAAFAAWSPVTKRYKIADRDREFNSTAEILRLITYWQQQVDREEGTSTAAALGGRFYIRAR